MYRFLFLWSFVIVLFLQAVGRDIYFMPQDGKEALEELIFRIQKAESKIDIAIYSFTNTQISAALKSAAKKGVKIRIVFDEEANKNDKFSQIDELAKIQNIECKTIKGKSYERRSNEGKMHVKLAIIDNKLLIFGSANWSKSAFESNYELIYFLEDYQKAKIATAFFEKLYKEAKEY